MRGALVGRLKHDELIPDDPVIFRHACVVRFEPLHRILVRNRGAGGKQRSHVRLVRCLKLGDDRRKESRIDWPLDQLWKEGDIHRHRRRDNEILHDLVGDVDVGKRRVGVVAIEVDIG